MRTIGLINRETIDKDSEIVSSLLNYCFENSYDMDSIYTDSNVKQEGLIKKGDISTILDMPYDNSILLVKDSSELATNLPYLVELLISFSKLNIKVECFKSNDSDVLIDGISKLGYSRPLSYTQIKINEAIQSKTKKGHVLGRIPIGYRKSDSGGYVVDAQESDLVKSIYSLYSGNFGESNPIGLRRISNVLNNNFPKPKSRWSPQSIKNIINNWFYVGVYKREGMIISNNHTAIVSHEQFEFVNNLMKKKKASEKKNISRKALVCYENIKFRCGFCRMPIFKTSHTRKWVNKDGKEKEKVYYYFRCHSYACTIKKRNKFDNHQMKNLIDENLVLKQELDIQQETPILKDYSILIRNFRDKVKLVSRGKGRITDLESELQQLRNIESGYNLQSMEKRKVPQKVMEIKSGKVRILTQV